MLENGFILVNNINVFNSDTFQYLQNSSKEVEMANFERPGAVGILALIKIIHGISNVNGFSEIIFSHTVSSLGNV